MAKTSKKLPAERFRFSVPSDDISVIQWLGNQHSISNSVRALIRDAIRSTGLQDVTCMPVEPYAKRGRPSNAEKMAREQAHMDDGQMTGNTFESVPEPVQEPVRAPERKPEPVREPVRERQVESVSVPKTAKPVSSKPGTMGIPGAGGIPVSSFQGESEDGVGVIPELPTESPDENSQGSDMYSDRDREDSDNDILSLMGH